jgi:hypothetical protein
MVPHPIRVGTTGHAEGLGELDEQLGRVGVDDATAGDDERVLRRVSRVRIFSACARVVVGLATGSGS